jgi:hypothetical protein
VFENRVLRGIFGPKMDEERQNRESYTMGSFIICTHHRISVGKWANKIKENEVGVACGTHGRGEYTRFCGKPRMKEPTWKTEVQMGGWDKYGT